MRAIHGELGQTVRVTVSLLTTSGPATQHTMRIVGVAVFPSFGRGSFAPTDLGTGAVVPASVLSAPSPQTRCSRRDTCYNFFLLRYRPGTDLTAAAARLTARDRHTDARSAPAP